VLPFEKETFRRASVDIVPGQNWGRRFEAVLKKAATITILNPSGDPTEPENYEFCNRAILGLARLKARSVGVDLKPVVMWDGQPGDGPGGTEAFVKRCRKLADPVILKTTEYLPGKPRRRKAAIPAVSQSQKIRAMLFADVVGFSKLDEPQIPAFVEHFMGAIAEALPKGRQAPLYRNTWGDAIYCVFRDVKDAGAFALGKASAIAPMKCSTKAGICGSSSFEKPTTSANSIARIFWLCDTAGMAALRRRGLPGKYSVVFRITGSASLRHLLTNASVPPGPSPGWPSHITTGLRSTPTERALSLAKPRIARLQNS
jgi:hypothetical protein